LAAAVLAKAKGLDLAKVKTLHDYQKQADLTLQQASDAVVHTLHKNPYTTAELQDILGLSVR